MDVVKKNALIPYKIKEAKKKKMREREKKGDMYKKYSTLYIYGDLSTNRKNTE